MFLILSPTHATGGEGEGTPAREHMLPQDPLVPCLCFTEGLPKFQFRVTVGYDLTGPSPFRQIYNPKGPRA